MKKQTDFNFWGEVIKNDIVCCRRYIQYLIGEFCEPKKTLVLRGETILKVTVAST